MERSAKYDNMKSFLIACVVLSHLGNRFADYSTSVAAARFWVHLFCMPAFIFVAGLFSKRTVNGNKWNKVVPYIFIYVGMELLTFIVSTIRHGTPPTDIDLFHENGIPWYGLAMFWWLLITILIRKVHPAYVLSCAITLAVFSGYISNIDSFLCMKRTIIFFPFFYLGYILDPKKLLEKLSNWPARIASALLISETIIVSFAETEALLPWRNLFRGTTTYMDLKVNLDYTWGFLWRLGAYILSFALVLAIICLMPSVKSYISTIGQRTLAVYFFHNNVMAIIFSFIPGLNSYIKNHSTGIICLALTAAIVFFTSLPCFDWAVKKIMNVPSRIAAKSN